MSVFWHWFVVVGVVGSLLGVMWLLFSNRHTSDKPTTGHSWDGIEELDNPLPLWWVGLFAGTVILAIPFLLYFPGLGNFAGIGDWTSTNAHDAASAAQRARFAPLYAELGELDEVQLHQDRRARLAGRRLFINHCSTCHGVNAQGGFGFPNLTDAAWQWGGDLESVTRSITDGRTGVMPAWGPALGPARTQAVVHYVLQLAGREHDAERAAGGAADYRQFCVVCHQADGGGSPQFGAPDLTDAAWLYGAEPEQISFTITHGRSGSMPAHADILEPGQIRVLAAYLTGVAARTAP